MECRRRRKEKKLLRVFVGRHRWKRSASELFCQKTRRKRTLERALKGVKNHGTICPPFSIPFFLFFLQFCLRYTRIYLFSRVQGPAKRSCSAERIARNQSASNLLTVRYALQPTPFFSIRFCFFLKKTFQHQQLTNLEVKCFYWWILETTEVNVLPPIFFWLPRQIIVIRKLIRTHENCCYLTWFFCFCKRRRWKFRFHSILKAG